MNPTRTNQSVLSSVAWPSDWRTVPLWAMFDRVKDVGHPHEELLSVYREHGVVKREGRDDNFNKAAPDRNIYQLIGPGWLVVNRMKAWQGSVGISPYRGVVSGHYICFRPSHREEGRFLNWILRSGIYATEFASLSRGVRPGQVEIDNDLLRVLPVKLPPVEEQRRIADFLDGETARIDRLIARMRSQDELLSSRRRAVLTATWHPEIRVARLGYFLSLVTSGPRGWGEYVSSEGNMFFRSANLRRDSTEPNLTSVAYVEPPVSALAESIRSAIHPGDVLVGITGANTGWVCLADQEVVGANVSQHVCLLRPSQLVSGKWLAYLLSSPAVQDSLLGSQYGGTKTQLSLPDLRDLKVPIPELRKQQAVADEIQHQIVAIESERGARARQLALLSERRQAVITAAVTGQLDVTTARPTHDRDL